VPVDNRGQAQGGLFEGAEHGTMHQVRQGMCFQHSTFFYTTACRIRFFLMPFRAYP
jgi:hypothetical protein